MKRKEYLTPEVETVEFEMNNPVLVVISGGGPESKDPEVDGGDPD